MKTDLQVTGILMELSNGESMKLAELVSVLVEEHLKPGTRMCPKCRSIKNYKRIRVKNKDGFDQLKYVCKKCHFTYVSDEVMLIGD